MDQTGTNQPGDDHAQNSENAPQSGESRAPITDQGLARTLARHPRALGGDPMKNFRSTFSLSGMILNNEDDALHHLSVKRKPSWLKAKIPGGAAFKETQRNVHSNSLHTVCEEANCPNLGECWARGVATIMILGDTCTRNCGFCNVKTGRPSSVDKDEPRRVAESLSGLGLKHIVITSVDRDDMPDGGAGIWAETIMRVREACPEMAIEVLVGDFQGDEAALQMVIDAKPNILAHNIETVRRCHPAVRPSARYERTIELLRRVKAQGGIAKTSVMVGIGERKDELFELFEDMIAKTSDHDGPRDRNDPTRGDPCDIMTVGQYLQPTRNHLPIDRWVHPDEFAEYETVGKQLGWKVVMSGPLVRSSYLADEQADMFKLLD
jgi:lipoic acid synthetase